MSVVRFLFPAARLLWVGFAWSALVVALRAMDADFNISMETGASADIRLTVPGGQVPLTGFLPVKVRIANRAGLERSWTLELGTGTPSRYRGNETYSIRSRHQFTVSSTETREFFIFVPVTPTDGRHGGIPIVGAIRGPEVANEDVMLPLAHSWGATTGPFAIEPALEEPLRSSVATLGVPSKRTRMGHASRAAASGLAAASLERLSAIEPAAWPADWRLWSSFTLVMLRQSTWERLDSARRRALLDWVVMGGRLILSPAGEGMERREVRGAGEIITLERSLDAAVFPELAVQRMPLGRIEAMVDDSFWNLPAKDWGFTPRHGWLTLFIIGFGVLVGPVNLFWLAPAGRRHRLFYTVPLVSLGATAALFVAIMISDGFGGVGTRRTLVVLVPEQNGAAVYQQQISRTGLLGGRTFPLPADASIERDVEGAVHNRSDDLLREGDEATGDWFTSRTTQRHTLARFLPTRERIEFIAPSGPDGRAVVQSTVGVTLRDFVCCDAAGGVWHASEVPPGTRVALIAGLPAASPAHFGPGAPGPGRFRASGDAGGLVLPTLAAIRWTNDLTLYTGHLVSAATP